MSSSLLPTAPLRSPPSINAVLPAELIQLILDLGAEPWPWPFTSLLLSARIKRKRFLCRCSRVCRDWTEPAQALLWDKIWVDDQLEAMWILKSSVYGRYQTRSLGLYGGKVSRDNAVKILAGLRGVQNLILFYFEDVLHAPSLVTSLNSLQGIQNLVLYRYGTKKVPFSPTDRISIPLRSLTFRHPLAVPIPFYSFFISSSLDELTFVQARSSSDFPDSQQHDFAVLFRAAAPQLVKLDFQNLNTLLLLPIFFSCSKIAHLTITADKNGSGAMIIQNLVAPLNFLHIVIGLLQEGVVFDVLKAVRLGLDLPSLRELKKLVMDTAWMTDGMWVQSKPEWQDVREKAEDNGCHVTFVEGR